MLGVGRKLLLLWSLCPHKTPDAVQKRWFVIRCTGVMHERPGFFAAH